MWNSPYTFSESGKRYCLADLSVLVLPLDELLYLTKVGPVADQVSEGILQNLERGEFVYALFEVFEALTSDVPIPEGGHPGVHQALIAELLVQSFDKVVAEIEVGEGDYYIRKAVWRSVDRFAIHSDYDEPSLPCFLEDSGLKLSDPDIYRSDKITIDHWDELLAGESFLFSEFLADDDWRMDSLLDLHPDKAKMVTELVGLNLDVVHALPHTPNEEELEMAERYLIDVIRKSERH